MIRRSVLEDVLTSKLNDTRLNSHYLQYYPFFMQTHLLHLQVCGLFSVLKSEALSLFIILMIVCAKKKKSALNSAWHQEGHQPGQSMLSSIQSPGLYPELRDYRIVKKG